MKQLNENQVRMIKRATGYKGRNIQFRDFTPGMSVNSYWDSGSRDYYYFVNLLTGHSYEVRQNGTMFDRLDLKADKLEQNQVLVMKAIFRGKARALYIYS